MKTNDQIAGEFLELFKSHIRGIRNVAIDYGLLCVSVSSRKAAREVMRDLLLCGQFIRVNAQNDNIAGGLTVFATVKQV